MRAVAVLFALLIPAVVPLAAGGSDVDECRGLTSSSPCHRIDVPSTVQQVPPVTYYLWLGMAGCGADLLSEECRGTSTNSAVFGGVLYQQTNALDGLQRRAIYMTPRLIPADEIILV